MAPAGMLCQQRELLGVLTGLERCTRCVRLASGIERGQGGVSGPHSSLWQGGLGQLGRALREVSGPCCLPQTSIRLVQDAGYQAGQKAQCSCCRVHAEGGSTLTWCSCGQEEGVSSCGPCQCLRQLLGGVGSVDKHVRPCGGQAGSTGRRQPAKWLAILCARKTMAAGLRDEA